MVANWINQIRRRSNLINDVKDRLIQPVSALQRMTFKEWILRISSVTFMVFVTFKFTWLCGEIEIIYIHTGHFPY